jgi:Icc-related predicted phosphoesterase
VSRLLFATDLHGRLESYRALFRKAEELGVRVVVFGGDLLPLPLGYGQDPLERQLDFAIERLAPLLREQRDAGRVVYGLFGNDDWVACRHVFAQLEVDGAYTDLHMSRHLLSEDTWIGGYSCVPVTPFRMSDFDRFDSAEWTPQREPKSLLLTDTGVLREAALPELRTRATIEEDLRELGLLGDPARTVYVCHTPPYGTDLDRMHGGASIGSSALRAFIEREQPLLTLHGHVHESPRMSGSITDRIGATLCVNPGDSRTKLRAVLVDVAAGTVEKLD